MIKYKDTQEKRQAHYVKRIKKQRRREENAKADEPTKPFDRRKCKRLNEELKPEVFFYKCNVPIRTEELPPFAKEMKATVVTRAFKKETSVFSAWKQDTPASLQKAFDCDMAMWKGHRFIKTEEEVSKFRLD